MCGIIAYIPKHKDAVAGLKILNQFQDQKDRGIQGFGLIEIAKEGVAIKRATETTKAILDLYQSKAPIGIFHHRQPTSTPNKMSQTHPILVSHKELKHDYYICHNGVISNDHALHLRHTGDLGYAYTTEREQGKTTMGYQTAYRTFNDSEAFAIELARFLEGITEKMDIEGSAAFIALRADKKSHEPLALMYGRDDHNPLDFLETKDGILIASDIYFDTMMKNGPRVIQPKTYEVLNLAAYFGQRTKDKTIAPKEYALTFVERPAPPPVTYPYPARTLYDHHSTKTSLAATTIAPVEHISRKERKRRKKLAAMQAEERRLEDAADRIPYSDQTEREQAFQRMGDRVCEDINDQIMEIISSMAEDNAYDLQNSISEIGITLIDTLEEKMTESIKVRAHFDAQEDAALELEAHSYGGTRFGNHNSAVIDATDAEEWDEIVDGYGYQRDAPTAMSHQEEVAAVDAALAPAPDPAPQTDLIPLAVSHE